MSETEVKTRVARVTTSMTTDMTHVRVSVSVQPDDGELAEWSTKCSWPAAMLDPRAAEWGAHMAGMAVTRIMDGNGWSSPEAPASLLHGLGLADDGSGGVEGDGGRGVN